MADRRMFSKRVVDSDAFLDMPMQAQLLYFHLSMRADDDGFVNNVKSLMRMCGNKEDDLLALCDGGFIILFDSGVALIRHWKVNNYIRKDAYFETSCRDELRMVQLDENGIYVLAKTSESGGGGGAAAGSSEASEEPVTPFTEYSKTPVTPFTECSKTPVTGFTECSQMPVTQGREVKERVGKDSIGERGRAHAGVCDPDFAVSSTEGESFGVYRNVRLSENELKILKSEFPSDYGERIDRLSTYMKQMNKNYDSHFATIRKWAAEDGARPVRGGNGRSDTRARYGGFDVNEAMQRALDRTYSKMSLDSG